jgi:hypothetical protein
MYGKAPRNAKFQKRSSPRPILEIVEQLHELLQIKQSALATAKGEFADSMMFNTLLRQEQDLYTELRTALGSGRRSRQNKKTG